MRNTLRSAFIIALLSITKLASALMINGAVDFTGSVQLNPNNISNATGVQSWNAKVESVSGDLDLFVNPGDATTFVSPWTFNSGAVNSFWSVGGFVFDLTSSSLDAQTTNGILVSGTGFIYGNGYTKTAATWFFSTQNPKTNGRFSFSAGSEAEGGPNNVPDTGSTLIMLGGAMTALASISARRKSSRS